MINSINAYHFNTLLLLGTEFDHQNRGEGVKIKINYR